MIAREDRSGVTEGPESGASRWPSFRRFAASLDTPWPIILIPALGYVVAGSPGYVLPVHSSAIWGAVEFVAFAAACFAGRRWGLNAMLPVIIMCIPFIAEVPPILAPGNFWTIPALLIGYRLSADPPWSARVLASQELVKLDRFLMLALLIGGAFQLVAFLPGVAVTSASGALLLPLLFVLCGVKRVKIRLILPLLLIAHAVFWLGITWWVPSASLERIVDFRVGLSPLDMIVCIAAWLLGRAALGAEWRMFPGKFGEVALLNAASVLVAIVWLFAVVFVAAAGTVFVVPNPANWVTRDGTGAIKAMVDAPTLPILACAHALLRFHVLAVNLGSRRPGIVATVATLGTAGVAIAIGSDAAAPLEQISIATVVLCGLLVTLNMHSFVDAARALPTEPAPANPRSLLLILFGPAWLGIVIAFTAIAISVPLGISVSPGQVREVAFESPAAVSERPRAVLQDRVERGSNGLTQKERARLESIENALEAMPEDEYGLNAAEIVNGYEALSNMAQ